MTHPTPTQTPAPGRAGVGPRTAPEDPGFAAVQRDLATFTRARGRRPRFLVVPLTRSPQDRGARVVATAFADMGFDVEIGPACDDVDAIVRAALDSDVHLVGLAADGALHRRLAPRIADALAASDAAEIRLICTGLIPPADIPELTRAGIAATISPGTDISDAAHTVLTALTTERDRGPEETACPPFPPAAASFGTAFWSPPVRASYQVWTS